MTEGIEGSMEGFVKNRVITALLQAYHDCLDYDGMKSILREAEMLSIKDIREINPDESLNLISFQKIIDAQNILMYGCTDLLHEIGKKFSFYLFPFGKDFEKIIQELKELIITNWDVSIIEKSDSNISVKVENCIFSTNDGQYCEVFEGFLVNSLQKALSSDKMVKFSKELLDSPSHTNKSFIIKLQIYNIKN